MLTPDMQALIRNYTAGMVATVTADGRPAVSPKATFVVVDEGTIAYGDIRSPQTRANIQRQPQVEVGFLDVLTRRAVRVRGQAKAIAKTDASPALKAAMRQVWAEYEPMMSCFIEIEIEEAEMVLSPAYDIGYSAADLRLANISKLQALE